FQGGEMQEGCCASCCTAGQHDTTLERMPSVTLLTLVRPVRRAHRCVGVARQWESAGWTPCCPRPCCSRPPRAPQPRARRGGVAGGRAGRGGARRGGLGDWAVGRGVPERPPFVSRGGIKLANALDGSGLEVRGRSALDVGASTGGFTDCLLQRGAREVISVD